MDSRYRFLLGGFMGDYIGSAYEFANVRDIHFPIFTPDSHFTDDSFMTCAVMEALVNTFKVYGTFELKDIKEDRVKVKTTYQTFLIEAFKLWYKNHPNGDYGLLFEYWLDEGVIPETTGDSYGNGALMRVSPCAYISMNLSTCLLYAKWTTEVSHNHPISYRAVACYITMLFHAYKKYSCDTEVMLEEAKAIFMKYYPEAKTQSIDELRKSNKHDPTCQSTMPLLLPCLFSSIESQVDSRKCFMYGLRTTISIGGDSDTLGMIVGCLLAHICQVPIKLSNIVFSEMSLDMKNILEDFTDMLGMQR